MRSSEDTWILRDPAWSTSPEVLGGLCVTLSLKTQVIKSRNLKDGWRRSMNWNIRLPKLYVSLGGSCHHNLMRAGTRL